MEVVTDFTFLGSMTIADGGSSHKIKRHLLLGRKAMTNLDSILKNRDITLPTKVHIVKAMVFPVAMYGSESWTIKKADCQRTDVFELWCWRRLLRSPGMQREQTYCDVHLYEAPTFSALTKVPVLVSLTATSGLLYLYSQYKRRLSKHLSRRCKQILFIEV